MSAACAVVAGGRLCALEPNSQTVRDSGWSENMMTLFEKLGVRVVDSDVWSESGHPGAAKFVHAASGAGLLRAMRSAAGSPGTVDCNFDAITVKAKMGERAGGR